MDSRFAFEVGCSICLQITMVIAATVMLQRFIVGALWQCRLWTLCFVCLITFVAAAVLLPHRRWMDFPAELAPQSMLTFVVWQTRIAIGLAGIWAVGAAWSIIRRVTLCLGLLRFLKTKCVPVDAEAMLRRSEVATLAGDKLSILTSDRIQGPFCWQLHRPVIVLPTFLLNDDVTLRHVLLHEFEHLRTQHPMQHFLQGVCSTVFWFHPMVWIAARDAELTREFLCDEVAAITSGKFGAYLRTLAMVAENCGSASCTSTFQETRAVKRAAAPNGTLAFGNQPGALVRRSNHLVELARREKPHARWRGIVAMMGLLGCAVLIQQIWLPTNAMASRRSGWSPWPTWTADALHEAGIQVRDFEVFENRVQMHELTHHED
jgi:bla regulator protein blaR1